MRYALLGLLFAGVAAAQTPVQSPDCAPIALTFVGGNGTAPTLPNLYYDNRNTQCVTWTVAYEADAGLSGYTVTFQSATGTDTPDAFGAYAGSTVASSASFGTAQYGVATFTSLSATPGSSAPTPWINLVSSGASGTGNLRVVFYGYRTGTTGGTGGGGGGGGGGGCSSPCPVVGTAASGAAPSGDPVQTAGYDGTDIRTLLTDTLGNLGVFQIGLGTFTAGQAAVTASAANLGSHTAKAVCVHALIANTINVYAGPSGVTTSTGMEIPPGQGWCWSVANANLIYVIASTTGASVSWSVTN